MNAERIEQKFRELFNTTPHLYRSPGRINLIGEHTDYNDGFVLPAAIDLEVVFAIELNDSGKIKIHAFDLGEDHEADIATLKKDAKKWPDYLAGVIDQLVKAGHMVGGFNCVFGSDIPIGAGLSSSAAIECGLAFAINELAGLKLEKISLAKIALKAEQEFAGLNCGIMDQFANLFGKKDHVIKLDCRSLDYEYYPLELPDYEVILCDTQVKHALASSEYNTRRAECEAGVKILNNHFPEVKSLRNVEPAMLEEYKSEIPAIVFQRCKYVVDEIQRVPRACEDLRLGKIEEFGKKMYETHDGLSGMYVVSCDELDYLVEIARKTGITGARMMGGGFGGCTINIVPKNKVNEFIDKTIADYNARYGKEPLIYKVKVSNGTSPL